MTDDAGSKLSAMLAERAAMPDQKNHEIGIHFGQSHQDYLDDIGIGSHGMEKLARNPAAFWWDSPMNPLFKDKDTSAKRRGRAIHTSVLESHEKFEAIYMRGPENGDDLTPPQKAANTKAAKIKAADAGKVLLPFDDYARVEISSSTIVNNPELKMAFQNGCGEVSIYWKRLGVKRKARLDYLQIGGTDESHGIEDLKTIVNLYNLPFEEACKVQFKRLRMDIQAAQYMEGKFRIPRFIKEGRVFGYHDPSWLKRVADVMDLSFQWVFFAAEGAPLTDSWFVEWNDPMVQDKAVISIDRAAEEYKRYMALYGPSTPWLMIQKPRKITADDFRYGYEVTW